MTRLYLVGTDTGVGKTALACALLRTARKLGVRAIPFKPAQSGGTDQQTDAHRLLSAAGLPYTDLPRACPFRYATPIAPGIAQDPTPFVRASAANAAPMPPAIEQAARALEAWEAAHAPRLVVIEGAGGLHVPMPGGTWQPQWIEVFGARTIVVADADLGTINHTLLTLDALADRSTPAIGFYLVERSPANHPARAHNAQVVATARDAVHLGTHRFSETPDAAGRNDLLSPLLDALS